MKIPDAFLTINEVASLLNVSTRSVLRYVKKAGLPAHKLGVGVTAPYRFDREEVLDWVRSRCIQRVGAGEAAA